MHWHDASTFMSVNHSRFTSRYTYKVDAKHRVALASSWRAESGDKFWLMTTVSDAPVGGRKRPILKALTQEEFDARHARIDASGKSEVEKRDLHRRLSEMCRDVYLNDQNKLVLPKATAESVGIQPNEDVGMVGGGAYFEIWNERDYKDYEAEKAATEIEDDLGIF